MADARIRDRQRQGFRRCHWREGLRARALSKYHRTPEEPTRTDRKPRRMTPESSGITRNGHTWGGFTDWEMNSPWKTGWERETVSQRPRRGAVTEGNMESQDSTRASWTVPQEHRSRIKRAFSPENPEMEARCRVDASNPTALSHHRSNAVIPQQIKATRTRGQIDGANDATFRLIHSQDPKTENRHGQKKEKSSDLPYGYPLTSIGLRSSSMLS